MDGAIGLLENHVCIVFGKSSFTTGHAVLSTTHSEIQSLSLRHPNPCLHVVPTPVGSLHGDSSGSQFIQHVEFESTRFLQ